MASPNTQTLREEPLLKPWWLPQTLTANQCWRCSVGPLSVYLEHRQEDWFLAWETENEVIEPQRITSEAWQRLPEELIPSRYVFRKAPSEFCLKPRLLDRPLVVKTHQPVKVPPGENITFYISSPVFVVVELLNPATFLEELPTVRLSDTWFGPSTREGELCYAATTHARNSREEVQRRSHRAITPVTIRNRSEQMLSIEKLSIPLPFLAVYGLDDGSLWTDPVTLEHTHNDALAKLELGSRTDAGAALSQARIPGHSNRLVRAFTSMFSD